MSKEFVESEHPRDELGQFAEKGLAGVSEKQIEEEIAKSNDNMEKMFQKRLVEVKRKVLGTENQTLVKGKTFFGEVKLKPDGEVNQAEETIVGVYPHYNEKVNMFIKNHPELVEKELISSSEERSLPNEKKEQYHQELNKKLTLSDILELKKQANYRGNRGLSKNMERYYRAGDDAHFYQKIYNITGNEEYFNKHLKMLKLLDALASFGDEYPNLSDEELIDMKGKHDAETTKKNAEYLKEWQKELDNVLTKVKNGDVEKLSEEEWNIYIEEKGTQDFSGDITSTGGNGGSYNSGYSGYSMSKRATEAYSSGEMPLSKWSAKKVRDSVAFYIGEEKTKALGITKDNYKQFLNNSSWHHSSKFMNEVQFYSLDMDALYRRLTKK